MKVATIVGARPQFIKCAQVSREIRAHHTEVLIHTGQHYDSSMSDIFFTDLGIPAPDHHLNIGSGSHGAQTGRMLEAIETVLLAEKPHRVIVYGDTNSTLAGALAAAKIGIPVAHVEAGVRSFDRSMPEEINRVLTDQIAYLRFCPTQTAVDNLAAEGITYGIHLVGDVMTDVLMASWARAEQESTILDRLGLDHRGYAVATIHRPANTDMKHVLTEVLAGLGMTDMPVVLPLHPRTRDRCEAFGIAIPGNIIVIDPLPYRDMLKLMAHADVIATDSGGIQKEAYILGVRCVTIRATTEWPETCHGGWNALVDADRCAIVHDITDIRPLSPRKDLFRTGASQQIAWTIGHRP